MTAARAVLSPSVLVLGIFLVAGVVTLSIMVSWQVDAQFGMQGTSLDDQRTMYLMAVVPNLVSGAATLGIVGALIGLPLVIGARLAAMRGGAGVD
ncbi:hypothetical protein ACFPER_06840 [Agromyces aurantiacus]|uniref:YibE/F family protein n=1 Tax=Agromyces aurantiacus TaxID=165814 RepID=A0ABV9R2Z5_9MICO|nr:hypothetical protein [Agromyces aurantiacus]MBM7503182.1 hypothetical protein [Agromyces aurantiacus]